MLAEKQVAYDAVEIDLDDRPAWLYRKNPAGRVPVLEEDGGFLLPESRVIMEYLDERYPEPALMPADLRERAVVRLAVERFDRLSGPYYDLLWHGAEGAAARLDAELTRLGRTVAAQGFLAGSAYTLADVAYVPWILRAESRLGIDVRADPGLAGWLDRLEQRPAVAQEAELLGLAGTRSA